MAAKATGISREFIIHPGEIIADMLTERGITQAELAKRTGVSRAFISDVINGKKNISASFAMALEYALEVPRSFWLNLQANYDAKILAADEVDSITDDERSTYQELGEIIAHLRKLGKLPASRKMDDMILALRKTLCVSNLENLRHFSPAGAFRLSEKDQVNKAVLGAWLQMCRLASNEGQLETTFDPLKLDALIADIKGVMCNPALNPQEALPPVLREYGISFSIVKNFKGAPVHGYISASGEGTYHMVLTIRRAWADIFWFSLCHELGHIVNGDVNRAGYFMDLDESTGSSRERLADRRAADMLLDPAAYSAFIQKKDFSIASITEFAGTQSVPPFIVIGRLQKEEYIPYEWFSRYKPRYKWAS